MNRIIPLWAEAPGYEPDYGQPEPTITMYPVPDARGAVLVLAGGGYEHKAAHESAPVARKLNEFGLSAAVLDYRVGPYRAPVPQWDALRGIQWLRHLAPEYGYQPDHVAILGFSAGGHLAASAAYLRIDLPETGRDDPLSDLEPCPDAAILCYPVITMGAFTHAGSRDHLLGPECGQERIDAWSIEQHIRDNARPAFIWHTSDDGAVPIQNSLMLASALATRKIPFSLHIWPHGRHGLGLAEETADIRRWPELAAEWLHGLGY